MPGSLCAMRATALPRAVRSQRCRPALAASRRWITASRRVASSVVVAAAGAPGNSASPSMQLGRAKLPADADVTVFVQQLYQWAATLTTNGRNLPFALPLKTDPLDDGFKISLLRVADGGRVCSVADIVARVEPAPEGGRVLLVKLFEGEGSGLVLGRGVQESGDDRRRLQVLHDACVDIPLILNTMPGAIRKAAAIAR